MKRRQIGLLLLMFAGCGFAEGRQNLTLEVCWQKARDNYPLIRRYGLLEASKQYTLSNIGKTWLPQVAVNAQATYQSDVVKIPVSMPGLHIPTMDKDQYRVTVDVSQTLWDGGAAHSQKDIAQAANEMEKQSLEVALYAVNERIHALFFGILSVDEQLKQLDILTEDLQTGLKTVEALARNGAATTTDIDAVRVELINTEQRKTEWTASRRAYADMLSAMIHESLDSALLVKPSEPEIQYQASLQRPEMLLFSRQKGLFDVQESSIRTRNMPRLALFLQGGYGKPGLNMLATDFDFFYIGGLRFNWNFGSLYLSHNDRSSLANQKEMTEVEQETFLFNTHLKLTQAHQEIKKAKELMERDDEIIMLRERVMKAGESKYANGVYTINDLIRDINAKNQAQQAKSLHEIQYLMSIYNYQLIKGDIK